MLVWGFGNAAHETARELQKFTQDCFENGSVLESTKMFRDDFSGSSDFSSKARQ